MSTTAPPRRRPWCHSPIARAADSRVTSVDVARRAGVSQSTVSLVMSGKARGRVSAETEKVVRRAAADLGYRPNAAARALRTGAARSVALIVPDVTNPFFGHVMRGAQAAAWTAGLRRRARRHGQRPRVGARLLRGAARRAGRRVPRLRHRPAQAPPRDARREDRAPGGRGARPSRGAPRLRRGRRRGHGPPARPRPPPRRAHRARRSSAALPRPRGALARALAAAGIDRRRHAPCPQRDQLRRGKTAALSLLRSPDPPTAIFCDDDILAGGVYLAARELGLRIPGDVSVVGFDDLDFTALLDPPLRPSPPTPRCSAPRPSRRSPRTWPARGSRGCGCCRSS